MSYTAFIRRERALLRKYWFRNPYAICRRYRMGVYGETPLKTLAQLAQFAHITYEDHLFELGCGRGISALYFASLYCHRVTAIDSVPIFIKKARMVQYKYLIPIEFRCENYLYSDLSKASCIYLYGTCLKEEDIVQLCQNIPQKVRVITISYPLAEYDAQFQTLNSQNVLFPWGETRAYLNIK